MWIGKNYKNISKLSDYLLWQAFYDKFRDKKGIVWQADNSMLKVFRYRGPDLSSSTKEELVAKVGHLNNVIKRFRGNWGLWIEAQRKKNEFYPEKKFSNPVPAMMDAERKNNFSSGKYYESEFYLTIFFKPPKGLTRKIGQMFVNKKETFTKDAQSTNSERFSEFWEEANSFYQLFKEVMYECEELTDEETLTYLHSTISPRKVNFQKPAAPYIGIASMLADTPMVGGLKPHFGTRKEDIEYIRILNLIGYPPETVPGILDDLNRMNVEYRWVSRFLPLDKLESKAYIEGKAKAWYSDIKSIGVTFRELLSQSESGNINHYALSNKIDADAAKYELENDLCSFGFTNTYVVLRNKNENFLDKQVTEVRKTIERRGFNVINEDFNSEEAWLASIPGMYAYDPREYFLSSLNFCHIFPMSGVWAGKKINEHLKQPALFVAQTGGSTPFYLNLHVEDIGNTMVVGPIGSGKSVLLNTLESAVLGYPGAKVYIFDKGGSCRAITAGVGGEFYDLATENATLSFQPLRNVDNENEKIWASEFLQMIFEQEGIKMTPEKKEKIWDALSSVAVTENPDQRTLGFFYLLVQDEELRRALLPFVGMIEGNDSVKQPGAYSSLFDTSAESIELGSWQAFEMGELMDKKGAVMPVLQYLFHVIEKNCDGRPIFIFLDECWVFLDNPLFAEKIREWFKTMRKNNVSVIFATQNLEDIINSGISSAIVDNCSTKIFLPNPNATTESQDEVYKRFDLNYAERQILASAVPKRQYYYKSRLGSRLFELALTKYALSYIGSASKEDQAKVREILAVAGKDNFNEDWLPYKGQHEALVVYKELKEMMKAN